MRDARYEIPHPPGMEGVETNSIPSPSPSPLPAPCPGRIKTKNEEQRTKIPHPSARREGGKVRRRGGRERESSAWTAFGGPRRHARRSSGRLLEVRSGTRCENQDSQSDGVALSPSHPLTFSPCVSEVPGTDMYRPGAHRIRAGRCLAPTCNAELTNAAPDPILISITCDRGESSS